MTLPEFKNTLSQSTPPSFPTPLLTALWYDGKGDWNKAHDIAQNVTTHEGAWIHAYLHRKEGDESNAAYWYGRAERPIKNISLDEEWAGIVNELLALTI